MPTLHGLKGKMMSNTAEKVELYNKISDLKEKLHKHGKAIARIEYWLSTYPRKGNPEAREVEKQTLETVLRIFKEEGINQ